MDLRPWHASYDPGVPTGIRFDALTIPELLSRTVQTQPDRTALIFYNRRITYRELAEQVRRLASTLAKAGVTKGTRVAIQLPNLPQTVIAFYAVLRLGGIVVMTNPLYTLPEMRYQWEDAGCTVAIVTDYTFDQVIRTNRSALSIQTYIVASIPEYLRQPLRFLAPFGLRRRAQPKWARVEAGPGVIKFSAAIANGDPAHAAAAVQLDDVALLQYTGGTTGTSKGATLTHRQLSANVQQLLAWMPALGEAPQVFLTSLPLFHVYGLTVCMNLGVAASATQVLLIDPRDTVAVIKAITKHKVTMWPAAPAMLNAVVNHPLTPKSDLTSLKLVKSGSAPLSVDLLHRFEQIARAKIVEGYGLSEASPVTHCNPLKGARKVGTIGLPLPDTDVRVVDDEGRAVAPGEPGEIAIKGPQVMQGYWQRPDETRHAIRDGWLFTGDLATVDQDGYFTIVGRKKDMIDASGYKVYPDEVDRVLMSHPAVLESATIGVPDEKRGETVKSFIVLKPGAAVTAEALVAFARESLAPFKVPKAIEFRESLPRSAALKILRRELRAEG